MELPVLEQLEVCDWQVIFVSKCRVYWIEWMNNRKEFPIVILAWVGEIQRMSVKILCEQFWRVQMRTDLTCIAKRCNYIRCLDGMKEWSETLWFKLAAQSKTVVTPSEKNEVSDQIALEYGSVSITMRGNFNAFIIIKVSLCSSEKVRIWTRFVGWVWSALLTKDL